MRDAPFGGAGALTREQVFRWKTCQLRRERVKNRHAIDLPTATRLHAIFYREAVADHSPGSRSAPPNGPRTARIPTFPIASGWSPPDNTDMPPRLPSWFPRLSRRAWVVVGILWL